MSDTACTGKNGTDPARVLIVDDHPAVREALALRISSLPDLDVCGEAADLPTALQLVAEKKPDIAIIDISLKNGDGLDLIKRIRARAADVRMLVWSMHTESLYAERALRAGAQGYITKEQATERIVEAIRQVLAGKVYLSAAMTEMLLRRAVGDGSGLPGRSPVESLADRELEVYRLIGKGIKTADVAQQLHLSVKTVETYRDRIREKLDLSNGTELVRHAALWLQENG
ncbi:MAG: response regulator transcription factor [Planctomycetes bacterium]|nr:response regulator transcription factor [Planctomycetota bacterium]